MPLYDYRCAVCNTEKNNVRLKIDDRHRAAPVCGRDECGMQLVVRATRDVMVKHFVPYQCPVTEKPVTNKGQRADVMAKHDLVDKADIKLRTVKEF